jgi:hypothetical protein
MPLVFVHGVNTRKSPEYDAEVLARDALFRKYCLNAITDKPDGAKIFNPYWGDAAAKFPWNCGFAHDTQPKLQSFGAGGDALDYALQAAQVMPAADEPNDLILSVAKRSVTDAVDLLWTAAGALSGLSKEGAAELAEMSISVQAYLKAQAPTPQSWVASISNDRQFVEKLIDVVEAWTSAQKNVASTESKQKVQPFGVADVLDRLKRGAGNAAERTADVAFGSFIEGKLPDLVRRFSRFFGDAFEYIKQRYSGSTTITDLVVTDLRAAGNIRKTTDELLVCIGHSMGGDILYDLLTDPSLTDVPACDLLITVASQVGLFEEIKLFKSSVAAFPPDPKQRVPKERHPRIRQWINVFDRGDPFGYPASTIFEAVDDFTFNTKSSSLSAHSAYFLQPTFHDRLRAHITEVRT